MQALGEVEGQLADIAAPAQVAHQPQALADQQVVVVVAGFVLLPGVGAFQSVQLQRQLAPLPIAVGPFEVLQAAGDEFF